MSHNTMEPASVTYDDPVLGLAVCLAGALFAEGAIPVQLASVSPYRSFEDVVSILVRVLRKNPHVEIQECGFSLLER